MPYRELGMGKGRFFRKQHGKDIFIYSPEELKKYVKKYNGKRDFAISVYYFELEKGTPRERHESAIFDCVFFDIDSDTYEGAVQDVVNLHEKWLKPHGIKAQVFFSGRKGFHIIIPFNRFDTKFMKKVLRKVQKNITEQCKLECVDSRVWGDTARILRVPNTIHTKSKLYCRPFSYEEITWLSEKELKNMAKEPSATSSKNYRKAFAEHNTEKMHFLLKRVEEEVEKEAIEFQRKVRAGSIKMPKFDVKACKGVREAMKGVPKGMRDDILCGLINYFRLSKTPKSIAKKKLLEFIGRCSGDKSELIAQLDYKLDYHYDSNYGVCVFLARNGFCENCDVKKAYE